MDKFWSKVNKTAECWEWAACKMPTGYGKLKYKGQDWLAHRLSYTLLIGPIKEGLTVDHLCRNRSCVNPDHMELVSQGENTLRGLSVSGINSRKTHCSKGHEYGGENLIVARKTSHRRCRTCERIKDKNRYPLRKEQRLLRKAATSKP